MNEEFLCIWYFFMTPAYITVFFLVALALSTTLRLWLSVRHMRHVRARRGEVPAEFAAQITLTDHELAADYTVAKGRLGLIEILMGSLLLLVFTMGGLLQAMDTGLRAWLGAGYAHDLALFASFALVGFVIGLPMSLYRTFRLEAAFGFNKMTMRLWLADLLKAGLLSVLIGAPLLLAVLWLMQMMGAHWWFYVWLFWMSFNLLVLVL